MQHGHEAAAYSLVLTAVVLVAVGDGLVQPTVYADAALLPDCYTQVQLATVPATTQQIRSTLAVCMQSGASSTLFSHVCKCDL